MLDLALALDPDSDSAARPRRWRILAALATATVHVAGLAALVIAATWTLDPLPRPDTALVAAATLPRPAAAPAGGEPARRIEPKETRRRVAATTQPSERPAEPDPAATGTGEVTGTGTGGGDGPGIGIGIGTDGLCVDSPLCDENSLDDVPPPAPEPPEIVQADLIEGRRIAGEPRIAPPDTVRQTMLRRDQKRLRATIKMCLDRRGTVKSLDVLASTGYQDYDRALLAGMRTWRYQPFEIRGAAVPVCTAVTFVYRME